MKLYDYQRKIVEQAKLRNNFAYLCDPGVGKTAMVINTVTEKLKEFPETIIFCPKIVMHNWVRELHLWTDETDIGVAEGTPKKRLKTIQDRKILIINYEATRSRPIAEALHRKQADCVILDESHKIKNPSSQQTKQVLMLSNFARFRYILTGTPVTNGYQDLFSQYHFLDRGELFGKNFYVFRNRYFYNANAAWSGPKSYPDWRFISDMKPDLLEKISRNSVSLKKEDCLDLPELVDQKILTPMTHKQGLHYKRVKDDMITWLEDNEDNPLVVQNALTKLIRLNEVVNGYLKLENGIQEIESSKLTALQELLENLGEHKAIVFCVFKENFKHIKRILKGDYAELHGGIDDKQEQVDKFNDMSNDCRTILVNPASGGIGINLKSAKYAIYYSRNFSLEQYIQSKARNYRAGSKDIHDKITHYHLVTPGTIDEYICESLLRKENIAKSIEDIKKILY